MTEWGAGFCSSLPRRRESKVSVWCGREADTRFRRYDGKRCGEDVDTRFRGYDGNGWGEDVDIRLRGCDGVGVAGFCSSLPRRRESMALVW